LAGSVIPGRPFVFWGVERRRAAASVADDSGRRCLPNARPAFMAEPFPATWLVNL